MTKVDFAGVLAREIATRYESRLPPFADAVGLPVEEEEEMSGTRELSSDPGDNLDSALDAVSVSRRRIMIALRMLKHAQAHRLRLLERLHQVSV